MMKLHMPTGIEYEYIEVEVDDCSAEEMRKVRDEYTLAFKGKQGLSEREFNDFLDNQLSDKPNHIESFEKLNDIQIYTVQCLKRAQARKAYKANK